MAQFLLNLPVNPLELPRPFVPECNVEPHDSERVLDSFPIAPVVLAVHLELA